MPNYKGFLVPNKQPEYLKHKRTNCSYHGYLLVIINSQMLYPYQPVMLIWME
jgi:hypothetical protein